MNLLDVSTNFIDFAVEKIGATNLNWIGKIIAWLIEGVGIIGLGIILFTLILKTITLPLDVYSRINMKKQSLIMEKMRPQMEKLQKQYANDKAMYSQKVMQLQKQNGYSMLGACLPLIVTLVIFIVVFNAFSTYSQYANLSTYNNMVDAYNSSVQTYVKTSENADGFLIEEKDEALGDTAYKVNFEAFKKVYNSDENNEVKLSDDFDEKTEAEKMTSVRNYVRTNARQKAKEYYEKNKTSFIWVKNLWYPDSMFNKEVPTFSKFSSSISRAMGSGINETYEKSYNEVTADLTAQKKSYNGYFVLIVLAIGLMFLQQFLSMRSQKAQNELSTVDGSGARTNKWMLFLMPVIYGVFSFMYSAAFSLYMITSSAFGLVTMLVVNKLVDVWFAKKQAKAEINNNRKRLK